MRCLLPALLVTSLFVSAHAAATYNNTVSGSQTASAESGTVTLNLNATGDLPGILILTLRHEGGNVSGGTWKLTVLPPNADATSSETGSLTGNFTAGTLTLDANGIVTAVNSVQLTVQSGTGQFEAINSGSATLSLQLEIAGRVIKTELSRTTRAGSAY
jgi:hypothetical protein